MNYNAMKKVILAAVLGVLIIFASNSNSLTNEALQKINITAPKANQSVEEARTEFCNNVKDALYINPQTKEKPIALSVRFNDNNDLLIEVDTNRWYDILTNGGRVREKIKETLSIKLAEAKAIYGEKYVSGNCIMVNSNGGQIERF